MNKIEQKLIKNMRKAIKNGEIPVSAVIVKNNQIIAEAYNTREKNKDVLGHAEINAIKKATKKLKSWNLSDCEMYITLEPCDMCKEIIKQTKMKKIYYFLGNTKKINYKTEIIYKNSNISEFIEKEMKKFFEKLR